MAEKANMSLSVKIAGGGYDDLFPYELLLEEGFSLVYRAQLTLLTTKLHSPKDLRDLLDQNVSLIISQRISSALVVRSRCLHGIITGITSGGIAGGTESGGYCYRYIFTIESELARLRWTQLNLPYYRKTPPDIIEEILNKYRLRAQFSDSYVNRSGFCKNLMFDQVNSSDLNFIHRIMSLYGLSWMFVHGQVAKNGIGTAELQFSEGHTFPRPFYEYSDKRKVPEIEKFDFINYDESKNIWKMDGWRMENTIGVDGLEISAPYPELNYGSHEWRWGDVDAGKRHYNYNSLFHGYERRTSTEEIDKDIKQIIEVRRLMFTLAKQKSTGKAENIMLMPGTIFELSHFYGGKDANTFTALVTNSRLHVRTLWPGDMASPPANTQTGELAQAEFCAADWGKDSTKRFCGVSAMGGVQ